MTEQEIKEKYPIGKRFVDKDGDVFLVVTHCFEDIYFVQYVTHPDIDYCCFSYQECNENFKPYTEPNTKTVYVHWCDDGMTRSFDKPLEKIPVAGVRLEYYDVLAIKKVTLTEGGFDES